MSRLTPEDYLAETIRHGSMRAAADSLGVEPSVITRKIQQLEDSLNTQLLERRGRGIEATEAALLVLEFCDDRRAAEEALKNRLSDLKGLKQGALNLAIGPSFLDDFIQTVITPFSKKYPGIDINIEESPSISAVTDVASGKAQLGVAFTPQDSDKIKKIRHRSQPQFIIVNPESSLATMKGLVPLKSLDRVPMAIPSDGTRLGELIKSAEILEGVSLNKKFRANNLSALKLFVRNNLGCTILGYYSAKKEIDEGSLVALPTSNELLNSGNASIFIRAGGRPSPALEAMMQMIENNNYLNN